MLKINSQIELTPETNDYMVKVSLRNSDVLAELRSVTRHDSHSVMQITPVQGQFLALLVKLIGAKKTLDIGTYTGYSSLCVALAMPSDSFTITCDINPFWGKIAEDYWKKAGVSNKIELCLDKAENTLNKLIQNGEEQAFDFIFIDADKINYDKYYEQSMVLLKKGGVIAIDNTFLYGAVALNDIKQDDLRETISLTVSDVCAIKKLNTKLLVDERVDLSMLPLADGLTVLRKR